MSKKYLELMSKKYLELMSKKYLELMSKKYVPGADEHIYPLTDNLHLLSISYFLITSLQQAYQLSTQKRQIYVFIFLKSINCQDFD
jgi:hypothetical protein